eukprot:2060699-Pleurochrysis_carterae.AAC.1
MMPYSRSDYLYRMYESSHPSLALYGMTDMEVTFIIRVRQPLFACACSYQTISNILGGAWKVRRSTEDGEESDNESLFGRGQVVPRGRELATSGEVANEQSAWRYAAMGLQQPPCRDKHLPVGDTSTVHRYGRGATS